MKEESFWGSVIIVFDSTRIAIEDVAAAAIVYERGVAEGAGLEVQLGG